MIIEHSKYTKLDLFFLRKLEDLYLPFEFESNEKEADDTTIDQDERRID
jgi:hypothetical protein